MGRLNCSSAVTNADLTAGYEYNNEGKLSSMGHPGYYKGRRGRQHGTTANGTVGVTTGWGG